MIERQPIPAKDLIDVMPQIAPAFQRPGISAELSPAPQIDPFADIIRPKLEEQGVTPSVLLTRSGRLSRSGAATAFKEQVFEGLKKAYGTNFEAMQNALSQNYRQAQAALSDPAEKKTLYRVYQSMKGKAKHEAAKHILVANGDRAKRNWYQTATLAKDISESHAWIQAHLLPRDHLGRGFETPLYIPEDEQKVRQFAACLRDEKTRKAFEKQAEMIMRERQEKLDQENQVLMEEVAPPIQAVQAAGSWKDKFRGLKDNIARAVQTGLENVRRFGRRIKPAAEKTVVTATVLTGAAMIAWGALQMYPARAAQAKGIVQDVAAALGVTPTPPAEIVSPPAAVAVGGFQTSQPSTAITEVIQPSTNRSPVLLRSGRLGGRSSSQRYTRVLKRVKTPEARQTPSPAPPPAANREATPTPHPEAPLYQQEASALTQTEGVLLSIPGIKSNSDLDGGGKGFLAPVHQVPETQIAEKGGNLPDLLADPVYNSYVGSVPVGDGKGVHYWLHDRAGWPGLSGRLSEAREGGLLYVGGRPWRIIKTFTGAEDISRQQLYWQAANFAGDNYYVVVQACTNGRLHGKDARFFVVAVPVSPDDPEYTVYEYPALADWQRTR